MRVTRESSWGKLINKQVTRWVWSRQIDMWARGTQKTRTEATCSHKTKTQAHGQQTIHQPCAKQDTNMQLMRTHKPRVHTRHENTRAHSQWKNTSCVQHSTRYNKCMQPIETRTATQQNVSGYSRNPCSLNRERDAALAAKLLTLPTGFFSVDGAFASIGWRRDCVRDDVAPSANELAWFYRVSDIGHARGVPKAWKLTQRLVPYSENKGYASNLRRSLS